MQQGGGGVGSQYGEIMSSGVPTTGDQSQQQLVEEASPISSRPPETGNLDEFMRLSSGGGGGGDEDALAAAGEEGDRVAGVSSSNRWPRQETLALLKIRSDMDAVFRDATVKGPLWEDVSRKLAELGYKRSAKKCKEKFENVHKYYKRTKEGRAGRQDGKSYKFFSELEALQSASGAAAATHAANVSMSVMAPASASAGTTLDVAPVSVGIPMPISSARISPNSLQPVSTIPMSSSIFTMTQPATRSGLAPMPAQPQPPPPPVYTTAAAQFGISFSSDSSSASEGSEDDDEEELGAEPSNRKRKRQSSGRGGGGETRRMMQFFEGLMKQVMQKQEAMQQRFLEAIEKREQDRMIRDEAWKRQEISRLAGEHELMAQERSLSASRDAAIVSFLQNITGQTIQLPTAVTFPPTVTVTVTPPPPTHPAHVITQATPISTAAPAQHPQPQVVRQQPPPPPPQQQQQQHPQSTEMVKHPALVSSDALMVIPEQTVPPQDIGGSGSSEPASSRWPKAEVLALINIRSGLESRYQEAGPKGPLWEEISAQMLRMGYKRNPKRCKEKWENINKYFKKVKESNKKRPDDAKTCPYFHQLDALYRKKLIGGSGGGGGSGSSSFGGEQMSEQKQLETQTPMIMAAPQAPQPVQSENKVDAQSSKEGFPESLFGEGNGESTKKPEGIMRELMEQQGIQQQQQHQQQQHQQQLAVEDYGKMGDHDSEQDMDEDDEEDENELEEDGKMDFKIEFQRQNTAPPNANGGGNGTPSFLTIVR